MANLVAMAKTIRSTGHSGRSGSSARTVALVGLVALVVLYGALLRFDALTLTYGPVSRPGWLRALQQSRGPASIVRPARLTWSRGRLYPHRDGPPTQYASDPYTYLRYAREMRSFYAAHRREPLFPFSTRVFLRLLHDQDVAVSFASAFFSTLAILATFLLGWSAFSCPVGLLAALGIAIEGDLVSWGVGGWRDDAFTCAVVLFAYGVIRCLGAPGRWNAALAGVLGGFACLVRITSLSFLVPGYLCLLFAPRRPWKARLSAFVIAVGTTAAIVGPFLINCWLAFGQPLYAINVHTDVYRAVEGRGGDAQTAGQYVVDQVRSRPVRTLDTVVLGMTSYPFANKWRGFEPWFRPLGAWLSWAAIGGLFLLLGSGQGRMLLLVLAASLIPYALTWRLLADWRFTEHAYPFYLIAASFAIVQLSKLARRAWLRSPVVRLALRRVAVWSCAVVTTAGATWFVMRMLPVLVVQESLRSGEAVTIEAGGRDTSFFTEGWLPAMGNGNVTIRPSVASAAVIQLPLPNKRVYHVALRLDPFPRPNAHEGSTFRAIHVLLNDRRIATLDLSWDPDRVGAYRFDLPDGLVRAGTNRLALAAEPDPAGARSANRFAIWYVRLTPVR